LTVTPALVPGNIKINGGAEVTNSEFATLDLPAVGAVSVQLSYNPDNVDYLQPPRSWAATINFRLTDSYHNDVGDGVRTIWARLADAAGNWTGWMSDSIVLDRGLPTISNVSGWVEQGARRDASVPVLIDWAGADSGVGVAGYDVAVSKDGGAWSMAATNTAAPGVVRNLPVGHAYRFRVRGTDRIGNRSGWTLSPTIRLTLVQDGSAKISYMGRWTKATGSGYWGGSARYASTASAAASIAFTGKGIAWVSPVGPTRGEAFVYVDGVLEATINLWAPAKGGTRVVFERSWLTSSAHTFRVVVAGTPGHTRVDVDGFLVGS
jgi:hypothetical protein